MNSSKLFSSDLNITQPISDNFSDRLSLFLNNASRSPLPLSHQALIQKYMQQWEHGEHDPYSINFKQSDILRTELSKFISCSKEQISIQTNVAQSFSMILHGIDWYDDSEVILVNSDYPSVTMPFQSKKGITPLWVSTENGLINLSDIEALITQKTRGIALSWVSYSTGQIQNISELSKICRKYNILLFVDATQALGVIPINLKETPIDFFTASLYKWCFCPQGIAVSVFSDLLMNQLTPISSGVFSQHDRRIRTQPNQPTLTARKFEFGNLNILGILLATQTFQWFNLIGASKLNTILSNLSQQLLTVIHGKSYQTVVDYSSNHASSIVSFYHPTPELFISKLSDNGGTATFRDNYIRLSPGIYQTKQTIEALQLII